MSDVKLRYAKNVLDFDGITVDFVKTLIAGTIKAFDTARAKAQYTAVAIMVLSVKDSAGAVEAANTIVTSLGDGVRSKGMLLFLQDKGGFRLNADGKKFDSVKNEEWVRANIQSAKDTPWWGYAPDVPFKAWDFKVELNKLLTKAGKMAEDKAHADDISIDIEMLEVVNALVKGQEVKAEGALKLVEKLAA